MSSKKIVASFTFSHLKNEYNWGQWNIKVVKYISWKWTRVISQVLKFLSTYLFAAVQFLLRVDAQFDSLQILAHKITLNFYSVLSLLKIQNRWRNWDTHRVNSSAFLNGISMDIEQKFNENGIEIEQKLRTDNER